MSDVDRLLHQIRNPLTAILTFAKLWQRRSDAADPNVWIVDRILGETQHLQALLAHYELAAEPKLQPLPLRAFIQTLWPIYDAIAQERQLSLDHDWDQLEITLDLDPVLLRQVIDNLMDNAFKYTHSRVVLKLINQGDAVCIQVRDDGAGIAAADLEHIFSPYFRGQDNSQPGRGLGLAIAKDLCERLGGSLSVASHGDQGTTFSVCFGGSRG